MGNTKTILEPEDYKSVSEMHVLLTGQFIPSNGLVITKNDENRAVKTPFTVDPGCRLELRWTGQRSGRVRYLTSTPRRRYFMGLKWYTLILWALSWIFTVIEIAGFGNYAMGDSRTTLALATAFTAWMGLVIVVQRNGHGFLKWASTIFSYFVLAFFSVKFILYIVRLLQETLL